MALITRYQIIRILNRNKQSGSGPASQKQLASDANISNVVLNRWLTGNREDIKLDTASRIAKALGLRVVNKSGKRLS